MPQNTPPDTPQGATQNVVLSAEHRMPYDDAAPPSEMAHDCEAVARELDLAHCPHHGPAVHPGAHHDLHPPVVSDDLATKGRDIHLHFH